METLATRKGIPTFYFVLNRGEGQDTGTQSKLKVCGNDCIIATRRTYTSQQPFLDRTEHQQPLTNTCIRSKMSKSKEYIYFAAGILHLAAS